MRDKDLLIKQLSENLAPAQVIAPISTRYVQWILLSLILVAGALAIIHPYRPGFILDLTHPFYFAETLFSFAPFFISGLIAIQSSVPGKRVWPGLYWLSALSILIYVFMTILNLIFSVDIIPIVEGFSRPCIYEILALSWIPLLALSHQVRKGYALLDKKLTLQIALAGVFLPTALMQVACNSQPLHNLYFHILPAVLGLLIFLAVGYRLLKINRS